MSRKRKCLVCGIYYRFCPNCAEFKNEPTWKTVYCSDKCKTTYTTLNQYGFGHITASEAKQILDAIGASKDSVSNTELVSVIESIETETKPKAKRMEKTETSE